MLTQNRIRLREGIDAGALARVEHFAQQIAHGINVRDGFIGNLDAARFCDLEREVQPLKRIDAEIELQTRIWRQPFAGVAPDEHLPNRLSDGLFKQCAIFAGHLFERHRARRGGLRFAFGRVEARAQPVTSDFPQPGARQNVGRNRKI